MKNIAETEMVGSGSDKVHQGRQHRSIVAEKTVESSPKCPRPPVSRQKT